MIQLGPKPVVPNQTSPKKGRECMQGVGDPLIEGKSYADGYFNAVNNQTIELK